MKKFRYRLQAVLKLKEHAEKVKQREHAAAVEQVAAQSDSLRKLEAGRKETLISQRGRMKQGLSVAEMLIYSRYLVKLRRDRLMGTEVMRTLQKEAEHRREELVEASRQRQTYGKLRERQRQRFQEDARRIMTKEDDEIAIRNYRHNEVPSGRQLADETKKPPE